MPSAVNEFVPVGLMGMLIAGLLAAFMVLLRHPQRRPGLHRQRPLPQVPQAAREQPRDQL